MQLKSGDYFAGRIYDISGTTPLKITVDTNSAEHERQRQGVFVRRDDGRKAAGALPNELAGALIGRIGTNGQPLAIGGQTAIPMPASGALYLGVNDDGMPDNSGQFNVVISRPGCRRTSVSVRQ